MTEQLREKEAVDIWRDSLLRYLGYANEVGESFRPIYSRFVAPSYALAFGYVGCDTLDKVYTSYKEGKPTGAIVKNGLDAFLWQVLASVIIPGKVVHLVTHSATHALKSPLAVKSFSPQFCRYSPVAAGLVSIPFIIHPIDNFVTKLLDSTTREWWA